MYFKRDIEKDLLKWKNSGIRSVLEVKGARQVGKTTTLLHFGENNYTNVIHIDLTTALGEKFIFFFKDAIDTLLNSVTKFTKENNLKFTNDKDTLIIIDEIQESEIVYKLIRPFRRQLNCDVIVTGSYLGKADKFFQPVGDVKFLTLDTLSFSEFIDCYSAKETYENMDFYSPEKTDWFKQAYDVYCVIGGYPAVVTAYLQKQDYKETISMIFNVILAELMTRTDDIVQYERIPQVLRAIMEVALKEKKGIKSLNENITTIYNKYNDFRISKEEIYYYITWLYSCGVIGYCNKIDLSGLNEVDNMRFYIKDLGLLKYIADKFSVNPSDFIGLQSETFVYRSLILNNFEEKFYGLRPAFGVFNDCEFDFIVKSRYDNMTYAIEVKAGKNANGNLKTLIEKGKADYVINFKGNTKGGKYENEITLPIWMAEKFKYNLGEKVIEEELPILSAF